MNKTLEELKELVDQEDLSEELGVAIIEDKHFNHYNGHLYAYAKERGYSVRTLEQDSFGPLVVGCYFGNYQLTMY